MYITIHTMSCPPLPLAHLLSALYYMEHFHWSLSDADKLSFSLVTLRAAVEYIRGPEVVKLLPGAEETRRLSSSGIKQIGLSHSPTHIQLSSKLQEGQTNSSILSTGGFWSHSELANTTLPSEGRWMEGHVLYEVADQRKQDKPQPRVDKKREETKSELGYVNYNNYTITSCCRKHILLYMVLA